MRAISRWFKPQPPQRSLSSTWRRAACRLSQNAMSEPPVEMAKVRGGWGGSVFSCLQRSGLHGGRVELPALGRWDGAAADRPRRGRSPPPDRHSAVPARLLQAVVRSMPGEPTLTISLKVAGKLRQLNRAKDELLERPLSRLLVTLLADSAPKTKGECGCFIFGCVCVWVGGGWEPGEWRGGEGRGGGGRGRFAGVVVPCDAWTQLWNKFGSHFCASPPPRPC